MRFFNPTSLTSLFALLVSITLSRECSARSIHRPDDASMPTLSVRWENSKTYTFKNMHLHEYPFFQIFDKDYFDKHLLPKKSKIAYRNDTKKTVASDQLSGLIEKFLDEIGKKKKNYSDFIVLQKKDFNRRKGCGLIVVKFKEYPFVLKLFIETPESFINPQCKGLEPIYFFYMGGGVNRHLSGFTRIKNLEYVNKKLAADPYWSTHASTPHKWFWLPKKPQWFEITGHNIGSKEHNFSRIPSTYGIIADAIESEHHFEYRNGKDRASALELCNYLGLYIDPNIGNFMIEKNSKKIVIVDTEHFPTIVGIRNAEPINNYISWFGRLISKCGKDMLFSTKKELRLAQLQPMAFKL